MKGALQVIFGVAQPSQPSRSRGGKQVISPPRGRGGLGRFVLHQWDLPVSPAQVHPTSKQLFFNSQTIRASQLLALLLGPKNIRTTSTNRRARAIATNRRSCAMYSHTQQIDPKTQTEEPAPEQQECHPYPKKPSNQYHSKQKVERVDRDSRQRPTDGEGKAVIPKCEK